MKMKKVIALSLLVASGFGGYVSAQSSLDLGSRGRLRAASVPVGIVTGNDGRRSVRAVAPAVDPVVRGFVELEDGATADALVEAGATVTSIRGNLALIEFPKSALEAIEASGAVRRITIERMLGQKLDRVRQTVGVDKIHSGIGLPRAYTGKGVLTGTVDGGFDPNHVSFLKEDGSTRFGRFTYYRPVQSGGYYEQIVPSSGVYEIDTESSVYFHGTHTLGIMAGGYRGDVSAAFSTDDGMTSFNKTVANPYYGIAYDSEIAVASGALTDYYIVLGVETILNYGYDKKLPAVVNLSLGSNVGPHDGSSLICQYLDQMSELDRVIFCLASGNEGHLPIALKSTLSGEDAAVRSCIVGATDQEGYPNLRYGQTYIYSGDATQFELQAIVINRSTGMVAHRIPMPATDGNATYHVTESGYAGSSDDIVDTQLAKYFHGYVGVGAEFDSQTGRYYAVLDYMTWDNTEKNIDGKYVLAFQVKGSEGQEIYAYCDGIFNTLGSMGLDDFVDGTPDGSVSDLACGKNCVVVGSYNTRNEWASVDGGLYGFTEEFPAGKISSFSSYGTLCDGRQLPTVCAPGASVISATNEYYVTDNSVADSEIQATLDLNGRRYSWFQSIGTSMSSPVVAGSIALWLEADPDLTYADVIDIIRTTATVDDDVTDPTVDRVKWGAGKFDAYAGLKEVLARKALNGISTVEAGSERPVVTRTADRSFSVWVASVEEPVVELYNASGMAVGRYRGSSNEATVDASGLPAGVYILRVAGLDRAERILVK